MKISIILPVFSETKALIKTVEEIRTFVPAEYIKEIIIMASPKSSKESLDICEALTRKYPDTYLYIQQNNPGLGWAFREAFDRSQGTHVLMMASDGETDPQVITLMIEKARVTGCDIVISNRWIKGGGFQGYSGIKKVLNYIFQSIIGAMYDGSIGDYTYAYRLYKIEVLKGHKWQETKHPFLLESLLRPLKRGCSVQEIPVVWHSRTEGKSQNTFWQNFVYFRTAVKIYFER